MTFRQFLLTLVISSPADGAWSWQCALPRKWNNYSRKPSFCVVAISNAPYRLKVPVLEAISSISSYATFPVAPRSVSEFTVVFVFFL